MGKVEKGLTRSYMIQISIDEVSVLCLGGYEIVDVKQWPGFSLFLCFFLSLVFPPSSFVRFRVGYALQLDKFEGLSISINFSIRLHAPHMPHLEMITLCPQPIGKCGKVELTCT